MGVVWPWACSSHLLLGGHPQGGAAGLQAPWCCVGAVSLWLRGSSGAVYGPMCSTVPRWGTARVTSAKMPCALAPSSAVQTCPGEVQSCQPTLLLWDFPCYCCCRDSVKASLYLKCDSPQKSASHPGLCSVLVLAAALPEPQQLWERVHCQYSVVRSWPPCQAFGDC